MLKPCEGVVRAANLCRVAVVDDHKVDHLTETYKERLFSLNKIKINLKI